MPKYPKSFIDSVSNVSSFKFNLCDRINCNGIDCIECPFGNPEVLVQFMKDSNITDKVRSLFKSGNDIPVTRVTIKSDILK